MKISRESAKDRVEALRCFLVINGLLSAIVTETKLVQNENIKKHIDELGTLLDQMLSRLGEDTSNDE